MRTHLAVVAAVIAACAAPAAAQPPRVSNGRVTTQPAGPLASTLRALVSGQADVGWIGYSVPVVDGDRVMCCSDSTSGASFVSGSRGAWNRECCGACRLESSAATGSAAPAGAPGPDAPTGSRPIRLEAAGRVMVLFRVVSRTVERIRVFSEECDLDAGGRTLVWLEGVQPAESLTLLEAFAVQAPAQRSGTLDGAVTAIALHADRGADAVLDCLVSPGQPEGVRRKVTFWLGHARGTSGLALLERVLREDPSPDVRKGAVFGVSQSRESRAFDVLAALARTAQDARIRSESIFWLAQQGDGRAPALILQALEKDPAPEVRKKAVFALSQLKGDTGTTALIGLAKTSPDPDVRGEAIFWLGQKAGAVAARAITDRIEQDPDTEVKKRAVFALSQMPPAEGVPLLINVARTHGSPAVRKQAVFWLGQSKDARAVAFFEEVLLAR